MVKGRRRGIRITVAAIAAGVLGLAVAVPAGGHKIRYDTNLQLKIEVLNDTPGHLLREDREPASRLRDRSLHQRHPCGRDDRNGDHGPGRQLDRDRAEAAEGRRRDRLSPKKVLKKNRKHRHRCAADIVTHKAP